MGKTVVVLLVATVAWRVFGDAEEQGRVRFKGDVCWLYYEGDRFVVNER